MYPRQLTCFIAMPFRTKPVRTGPRPEDVVQVDFDAVYRAIIRPAVEEDLGLVAFRVDTDGDPGQTDIDDKMWTGLANCDLCLIDISGDNPNVFYELGVRHALRRTGAVIIRHETTLNVPFDIKSITVDSYSLDDIAAARALLVRRISGKIGSSNLDSPVHGSVEGLRVKFEQTRSGSKPFAASLRERPERRIGVLPGDIRDVRGSCAVEAWVNSENTLMEMARPHDSSISAIIRYLGARRDARGEIVKDQIALNLRTAVGNVKNGRLFKVDPMRVFNTASGDLAKSHGVKRLFHVASVEGTPGRGYAPVENVSGCVTAVLHDAVIHNRKARRKDRVGSILFPLFGTGAGNRPPEDVVDQMIGAALRFLKYEETAGLDAIWFLAYTNFDEGLCVRALRRRGDEIDMPAAPA